MKNHSPGPVQLYEYIRTRVCIGSAVAVALDVRASNIVHDDRRTVITISVDSDVPIVLIVAVSPVVSRPEFGQ